MRYAAHPVQRVLIAAGMLILLAVAVLFICMGNIAAALVFAVLLALDIWLNSSAFNVVELTAEGIRQTLLGRQRQFLRWEQIEEVGVLPQSAQRRLRRDKRPSQCSLYYSAERLDNEKRLSICLKGAPRGVIDMGYRAERLRETARYWHGQIIFFNVSARELFGQEAALFDLDAREIRY